MSLLLAQDGARGGTCRPGRPRRWFGLRAARRRYGPNQRRSTAGSDPRLLPHLVGFDDVAEVQIVVVAQSQTTLVALADLGGVVLEALERGEAEVLGHHLPVAQ